MMIFSIFGFPPMAFIFGIAYLIMFIWQIFSARAQAREFNKLVKESGERTLVNDATLNKLELFFLTSMQIFL